jgi:hypothetical protein
MIDAVPEGDERTANGCCLLGSGDRVRISREFNPTLFYSSLSGAMVPGLRELRHNFASFGTHFLRFVTRFEPRCARRDRIDDRFFGCGKFTAHQRADERGTQATHHQIHHRSRTTFVHYRVLVIIRLLHT